MIHSGGEGRKAHDRVRCLGLLRGNGHQRPIVAIEFSAILWVNRDTTWCRALLLLVVVGLPSVKVEPLGCEYVYKLVYPSDSYSIRPPSFALPTSHRLQDFGIIFRCFFRNLEKLLDWTSLTIISLSNLCSIKASKSTKCVHSRWCSSWARL